MIIDAHLHLSNKGWVHEDFSIGAARIASAIFGKDTGESIDAVEFGRSLMPLRWDPSGEVAIATMDEAGVDKSCIFALDWGLLTGDPQRDMLSPI